jgi:hypothetical protein
MSALMQAAGWSPPTEARLLDVQAMQIRFTPTAEQKRFGALMAGGRLTWAYVLFSVQAEIDKAL